MTYPYSRPECSGCGKNDMTIMHTIDGPTVRAVRDDGSAVPESEAVPSPVDHTGGQIIWCWECNGVAKLIGVPLREDSDA